MPEYSIGFSEKLIEAARSILPSCVESLDARRTVLYLSLLSSEISLKSLLEHAGKPIGEIVRCQHRLADLLEETDKCYVNTIFVAGGTERRWIPATSIRALTIHVDGAVSTVGAFLNSEKKGASQYPNEVRYGEKLVHFPPEAGLDAASFIVNWAREHWKHFRLEPPDTSSWDYAQQMGQDRSLLGCKINTQIARTNRYIEFVKDSIDKQELEMIRGSLQRGQLTGNHHFVDQVEQITGRRIEHRLQGNQPRAVEV